MNYINTIDIILSDIEELKDLIRGFKKKEKISQIEIDLTLEKLRKLYDVLLLINSEGLNQVKKQVEMPDEPMKSVHIEKTKIQVKDEKNFIEDSEEEIVRDEKPVEDINAPLEITEEDVNADDKDEDENVEPEIEMIADRFQAAPSRNERIAEKTEINDISSRLKQKHVDDIKKVIGINDKFLFTKLLFKSNPSLYNQTIEALNSKPSLEEALEYIETNFDWNYEDEAVFRFLEIIKRKYSVV